MRVIHVSYSDIVGGAAKASYRLHEALTSQGISSKMYVISKSSTDDTVINILNKYENLLHNITRRFSFLLYRIFSFATKKKFGSLNIFGVKKIVYMLNMSDADIIHIHWIGNETISIFDFKKITKPLIFTSHDMWLICGTEHTTEQDDWKNGYRDNNLNLNRYIWKLKMNHIFFPFTIVSPSTWLTNCMYESPLYLSSKKLTIPNPINSKLWSPLKKNNARHSLELPLECPIILFGGSNSITDSNKGFELLLASLDIIKHAKKIIDFMVIIFGDNSVPNSIHKINSIGIINDQYLLRNYYCAADLVVTPSRVEAFCQVAAEAQSCGTPVVAFKSTGIIDVVIHKQTGYLAKPFDVEDFAAGIEWTLKSINQSSFLSRNSREHAISKFNSSHVAQAYIEEYKKLIKLH